MTAISTSSAALAILSQSGPSAQAASGSAADRILDIVSGRKAAGSTAAESATAAKTITTSPASGTPREVGGTVSSEIPKATIGAMSAAGRLQFEAVNGFTPPEQSLENAESFVRRAIWSVDEYNRGFDPDKVVPPRDEYNARYAQWGADRIAKGEDAETVNREVARFTSDSHYDMEVRRAEVTNSWKGRHADLGATMLKSQQDRLAEIFSFDLSVSYDEAGKARIDAFEMYYSNGNQMLSYSNDGSLTTYNQDGSFMSIYTKEVVAKV